MVKDLKQSPDGDYPWMRKVQLYIANGQIVGSGTLLRC